MKVIGLGMITAYQRLTAGAWPSCRYSPTCWAYTYQAIERYGLLRGSWMGGEAHRPMQPIPSRRLRPGPMSEKRVART